MMLFLKFVHLEKTRVAKAEPLSHSPCLPHWLTQADSCPLLSHRNSRGTAFPVTVTSAGSGGRGALSTGE